MMLDYNSYNNKAQYYVDFVLAFIGENPEQYSYAAADSFVTRHRSFFDEVFDAVDRDPAFDIHAFCVNEIHGGKYRGEFEAEK